MISPDEYKMVREDMARLREEVISRVRTIRRMRAFLASPMSSASLALVLVLCTSILVSFGDIVNNIMAHSEWGGRFSYTYSSLVHARVVVQVLALLTSLSCLVLLIKILSKLRTPAYFIGNFISSRTPLRFFRS